MILISTHFFCNKDISAVLANCGSRPVNAKWPAAAGDSNVVHTDFFAVRPSSIPVKSFSDWASAKNSEGQATRVFLDIISRKACAWILPFNNADGQCRVRGNGLWHGHGSCIATLAQQPWKRDKIWRPLVPETNTL